MRTFIILIISLLVLGFNAQVISIKQSNINDDSFLNQPMTSLQLEYAQNMSIVNLVFGLISLLCGIFLVVTYCACKEGRNTPGDLIFALGWISIIMSVYWIGSPIYFLMNQLTLKNMVLQKAESSTCRFYAFLETWTYSSLYAYNFAYCVTLRYKIQHVLKENKKKMQIITQIICLIVSLIPPIFFSIQQDFIISDFGMCVPQIAVGEVVMGIILLFTYFLSCIYTVWFSYKNIPNNADIKELKKKILMRQVIYIISTAVLFLILAISTMFVGTQSYEYGQIYAWSIITNIAFLAIPLALVFLRYTTPVIQIRVNYFFKRAFFLNPDQLQYQMILEDLKKDGISDQTILQGKIRENQIRAILIGIKQYYTNPNRIDDTNQNLQQDVNVISYSEDTLSRFESIDISQPNQQPLLSNRLQESEISESQRKQSQSPQIQRKTNIKQFMKSLNITNKILNQEFQFHVDTDPTHEERELTKRELRKKNEKLKENPRMSILSPIYFEKLFELDAVEINAALSFDCENNAEQIQKQVGPDGGKSGEFFFFTFDNQWILKTITEEELHVFRRMMPQYLEHMYYNRDTFINKIYGIFSLNLNQMTVKYNRKDLNVLHFILQRNISYIGGKYIRRTFDLKGSQEKREVLPEDETQRAKINMAKITMKDIDFEKTEGRARINDEFIYEIREVLTRDSKFFKNQNVMDYSLLLMKVSWGDYLKEHPSAEKNMMNTLTQGRYGILKEEPETFDLKYYHIAIIDYLQLWNAKKILEKNAKKMMKMKRDLDTSAQDPQYYSDRFIENVVKKIFQFRQQESITANDPSQSRDISIR